MRIRELHVEGWRNVREAHLIVPADAPLVCLIGENGAGKTSILELIAAVASRLGLAPGIDLARGNPLEEPHHIRATVEVTGSVLPGLRQRLTHGQPGGASWDSTLLYTSERRAASGTTETILAGGVSDSTNVAQAIIGTLQHDREVRYLYLDANRSYPRHQLNSSQFGSAIERNWQDDESRRSGYRQSPTLYTEWIQYAFGIVQQDAAAFHSAALRSRQGLGAAPDLSQYDSLASFRDSLRTILPHLSSIGGETRLRNLAFDVSGNELSFDQLSGGEREIAFLVGQIERFRLREGLLLVDEPELHLNSDLIRHWIRYLRDTVQSGQVWIATHALEAAEVTGPESVFVVSRPGFNAEGGQVQALAGQPLIRELSATLGTAGFSISNRKFVFIEGDRVNGERERFARLCGLPLDTRFIEAGTCTQVIAKVRTVTDLAESAEQLIRVGGIVDMDYRTDDEARALEQESPVHVLRCHEVENLFLHPDSIGLIAERNGHSLTAIDLTMNAADRSAGMWILQCALAKVRVDSANEQSSLRGVAYPSQWGAMDHSPSDFISRLRAAAPTAPAEFEDALEQAYAKYREARLGDDLWAICNGKQALSMIAEALGIKPLVLQEQTFHAWGAGHVGPPAELRALREFVAGL